MKTAGAVVREPFRHEQPEMAVRLETVLSGLGPWEKPSEEARESWLRDVAWVLALLRNARDHEATERSRRSQLEKAINAIEALLAELAPRDPIEAWVEATRLDEVIRWSFLSQIAEGVRAPLAAVSRTLFLIGPDLSAAENFDEDPGPVGDHWLAGSVGELRWLARQNPQLGAGLAEAIAALRSLGSADGEEVAR